MLVLIIYFYFSFVSFLPPFSKKALKATNDSGIQAALDWLEAKGEDEANFIETSEESAESADAAKKKTCLMCNACKKKFSNLEQAELHAARTLHDDFVEAQIENESEYEILPIEPVKVLSEEEKAARLTELRAKLAIKRAAREKEAKESEGLRKASAKELEQIKRDMQAKEMKHLAEERRQEKIADKKRREEIIRQIEEDRENKKRQIEAEKAKLAGSSAVDCEPVVVVVDSVPIASHSASCARIQIKLPAPNPPLKLTFDAPSTQTLRDLKDRIKLECPAGVIKTPSVELMQTFPTRMFGNADDACTLSELGLAPSASLILK